MRVLIVGAGGHGQVAAEILLRCAEADGAVELVGFVYDNPSTRGRKILGMPVMGTVANVTAIPHDALVIAAITPREHACFMHWRRQARSSRLSVTRPLSWRRMRSSDPGA